MNTQLEPPPVPPLTPAQRSRIRNQVMDKARPSRRTARRWAAPAIAVGAVAAVVAGTLAVTNQSPTIPSPEVAGTTPTPGPSATATPSHPSSKPATPVDPKALALPSDIDLGAVPAAEAASVARKSCKLPNSSSTTVEPVWARRVQGLLEGKTIIVMLVKGPGQPGGYYDEGMAACQAGMMISAVRDTAWAKRPTKAEGLSGLGASGFSEQGETGKPVRAQLWTIYRARPEIARVESRYVWKGGSGPWIKGVVADGFAYTDSCANSTKEIPGGFTQQIRAYDAQGKLIPVQPS